jgi:NAD(P)-dependent dehydrogenase (short-subunit alcohol dehydrogenase family)
VPEARRSTFISTVRIEETWPGVIEATERRFGRFDVMVANAGIGILCKAVEMSLAD